MPSPRNQKWLKKCPGAPDGRRPMLRTAIIEPIAEMYSTTADEVTKDLRSLKGAEEALNEFYETMEKAGY